MHIIYFLTYDYSFESWSKDGNLSREIKYFNEFQKKSTDIVYTFISYGNKNDTEYFKKFENNNLISIYEYVPYFKNKYLRFLVSLTIPFVLRKILKNKKIDLIKQNQLQGSWVSMIFKFLIKKPYIVRTGYDVLTFKQKENKPKFIILFYNILTKACLSIADIYTVTSKVDKSFLKNRFKKDKKIKLRRNFIEVNNTNNNISSKETKIVCVGRLEKQKNFKYIINELKDTSLPIEIFGSGSQRNELNNLISNVKNQVTLMGQRENEEIINYLNSRKYFISSSLYEGNPKGVLEAMSQGCIVFVSKNENTSEIINNGVDGFLYNLEKGELKNYFASDFLNHVDLEIISTNAKNKVSIQNSLEKLVELEISDFNQLIQKQ